MSINATAATRIVTVTRATRCCTTCIISIANTSRGFSSSSSTATTTNIVTTSPALPRVSSYPSIILFGGTGPTGVHTAKSLLQRGHRVTAVVRRPGALSSLLPGYGGGALRELVVTNVTSSEEIAPIFDTHASTRDDARRTAVVSCLGAHGTNPWLRSTLYSDSAAAISSNMTRTGISRVICTSSLWCQPPEMRVPIWQRAARSTFAAGFIHDMSLMETIYANTKLNWTSIRPPGLTDEPPVGTPVGDNAAVPYIPTIPRAYDLPDGASMWISRADVASVIVHALYHDSWSRMGVAIGGMIAKR